MPNSGMPTAAVVSCFCSKGAPAQRDHLIATGGTGSLGLWKPGIIAIVECELLGRIIAISPDKRDADSDRKV